MLVAAFEESDTAAVACADADVNYKTYRRWMNKGEDAQQGEYRDFYDTVNAALMIGRRKMERRAAKESRPLEYLAVRYPEDWAKPDRAEIGGTIKVVVEWATEKDKTDEKEEKA